MLESLIPAALLFDPASIVNSFLNADSSTIYLMVFCFMVIESSFIPFPSEVIVPPAAYLACTSHEVNIWTVIILATVGAIVGALVNYLLSWWIGRPIVYRFADSKFGHACLIDRAKVDKDTLALFRRPRSRVHIHRPTDTRRAPAHIHTGRHIAHEHRQVHNLHRTWSRTVELHTRRSRLLAEHHGESRRAFCQC